MTEVAYDQRPGETPKAARERHRIVFSEQFDRIVRAYQLPKEVRASNAALLARLVSEAEQHRAFATWTTVENAAKMWGSVEENAKLIAEGYLACNLNRASCVRSSKPCRNCPKPG